VFNYLIVNEGKWKIYGYSPICVKIGFNSIKISWNDAKLKFDDDPIEYEFITPYVNVNNLFFYDYKLSFELIGQIKYLDGLNNKYIDVKLGHTYDVTKLSAKL